MLFSARNLFQYRFTLNFAALFEIKEVIIGEAQLIPTGFHKKGELLREGLLHNITCGFSLVIISQI
jgi:hypothetical protein